MTTIDKKIITVEAKINVPVENVWNMWSDPYHIIRWNNASDDWQTTYAENDFRTGGKFLFRMEAKDGSFGFDFVGEYVKIQPPEFIEYNLADLRNVRITFIRDGDKTIVRESFEAEQTNSPELQKSGWQAILDNFKKHAEKAGKTEILHFEIVINSLPETVFKTMLDKKTYEEWSSVFNPTSHFEGSWNKGSKIVFLGTDNEGKTGGMVSRIRENLPGRFLSIEHLGIISNGNEITSGPDVEEWAGMLENYTFTNENGRTLLSVDIDSNQEFRSYFTDTWPVAMKKLKSICEK